MSSNGNIFRVVGPLCGEFTGHKGQWRGTLIFSLICDCRRRWFETPSRPLWRHCNKRFEISPPDHCEWNTYMCIFQCVGKVALARFCSAHGCKWPLIKCPRPTVANFVCEPIRIGIRYASHSIDSNYFVLARCHFRISSQANTNVLKCSKHSYWPCESKPIRISSL